MQKTTKPYDIKGKGVRTGEVGNGQVGMDK